MSVKLKPLREQTLVITGASSGIGLATARSAAARGARVLLVARDSIALAGIVDEIRSAGGVAEFVSADVGEEAEVEAAAQSAIAQFGGFDSWVNNAGVGTIATLERTASEDHRRVFQTNYFGIVYGSMAALRHFRETGKTGAIVNVGSALSDLPMMFSVPYAASKHAVKGFTEGLRVELLHEKLPISVTLIQPSGVNSRFFDHAKSAMGGMGRAPGPSYQPEVVADAILHAAEHPVRDIKVGSTSVLTAVAAAIAPRFADSLQARLPDAELIDFEHTPEANGLYAPPTEGHVHSRFRSGRHTSLSTAAQMHPFLVTTLVAAAAAVLLTSAVRARQ